MAIPNPKFEDSYGRLFGPDIALQKSADDFFYRFYERFLKSDEIAALFRATDMDRQVQMLKRSLVNLVAYYVTGEPGTDLTRIAQLHQRLRVKPQMYERWLLALVETVLEFDPQADEETRLAWCWAMSPGITYMRLAGTAR
ncbi:MAG: globin [Pseudomonadales bacterium]